MTRNRRNNNSRNQQVGYVWCAGVFEARRCLRRAGVPKVETRLLRQLR